MTVQSPPSFGVPAKPAGVVEVYDFRRPTTLAREHSRVLELACETFARQWGTQLTAKVRARSHVSFEQVRMQTYDAYAASLPATTAMVLCTVEGSEAKAVIQFPTGSALSWISHMLGGDGTHNVPERKFTPIEQALVRRLMDDAIDDLRYSFGNLIADHIAVESLQYNSQFAQAASTNELMIVALFGITVGGNQATATLALPADVLLAQLGETNPISTPAQSEEQVKAQLTRVAVDVSLRLSPATVRPRDVLELAVGDLISLPHPQHRPLDVTVEGQPIARAALGANGSRLACVIVETQENAG